MNENSPLSWSTIEAYESCPQGFLWSRGWGQIDLGRGPGKPKPLPTDAGSRHHAAMGSAIQYAIERMYNDELYRDPKTLQQRLLAHVDGELERQEKDPRNRLDYRKMELTRDDLRQICHDGVLGYLGTMKAHRLLGTFARAEVELRGWIDRYTQVMGRADVIVRRDDTGLTILDGKNTKKPENLDPDQLRFYALLYRISYREVPDRLGFVPYRFPYDPSKGQDGVIWVPFTSEDLDGLAARAVAARLKMRKEEFDPIPTPPKCGFCDYESICPARQAQRTANASRRKAPEKESLVKNDDGFADLSI